MLKSCVNYRMWQMEKCSRINIYDIEDEYHFLLCCHSYNDLRNKYIPSTVCTEEGFINLMSTKDENILFNLSASIYHAMQRRESLYKYLICKINIIYMYILCNLYLKYQ